MATTVPNRSPLIVSPHLYLADVTGRPLDYGCVYFGKPNEDGEFYPIDIFSDKELTKPLSQPVHTKGGFLHNNGDMVEVFAYDGVYSVKVLDQYGRKVFFKAEVAKQTIEDVTTDVVDAAQVVINERVAQLDDVINAAAAAGAGANGWDANLVSYGQTTQKQINDGLDSIAQLLSIKNPRSGMRVDVKSYNTPNYALNKPFDNGGGTFVYDAAKSSINDGGIVINGWVRQDTKQIWVNYFGTKGDGVTNDSPAYQKAVDYCEKNQIKTLHVGNGDYLLNDKVYFYRGGVNVVGQGALQREESWAATTLAPYPDMLTDRKGDVFSGCSIIVPKNSTAFVFAKSVVDHVYFSMMQFKAKEGRKVGTTNAIDFFSEFSGPTWGFTVMYCHFNGFNKAVNIQSPTQYCVAFVDVSRCSFVQNDEILYFSDMLDSSKWGILGSRNQAWGLTFEHNRCHDNTRLIRGSFAKDLVKISQNNLEGSIAYADGTHPKYAIDLELYNCDVIFEGNHGESVSHDILFASTYMRKPDGTRHTFENNQTGGGWCSVTLKGNNFDGVEGHKPVTLEGVALYDHDNYLVYLHGCTIKQTTKNSFLYKCTDLAKTEASGFVFPVNTSEHLVRINNNQLAWSMTQKHGLINASSVLMQTPVGFKQVTKCNKNSAALFNYSDFLVLPSAKFYGVSLLVNIPKSKASFDAARFYVTYSLNGQSASKTLYIPITSTNTTGGWNIFTSILPVKSLPDGAVITSLAAGFATESLMNETVIIDPDVTVFAIDTDDYHVAPYFFNGSQVVYKKGTFDFAQIFYDDANTLNVCIKTGTVGDVITTTATGSTGSSYFTAQDAEQASKLSVGAYIKIADANYRVINIIDNKVYVSPLLQQQLANTAITYDQPTFKTATLT